MPEKFSNQKNLKENEEFVKSWISKFKIKGFKKH